MRDNVTATERCGWLMRFHTCVKEKVGYLSRRYGISIHQWHTKYSCFLMLNSLLLLIISRWIMVWNKSVWMTLFTNVYQYDVIITSSATINSYFLHCQNLPFLSYAHCSFCLNWHIFHGDMKETVSGCFFSEHSVCMYVCIWVGQKNFATLHFAEYLQTRSKTFIETEFWWYVCVYVCLHTVVFPSGAETIFHWLGKNWDTKGIEWRKGWFSTPQTTRESGGAL